MTDDDFKRLESKVDKLSEAVMKLVLVEERLSNQGERMGRIEQRVATSEVMINKIEKKVDQWINRGIGAWAIASILFMVIQFGTKFVK